MKNNQEDLLLQNSQLKTNLHEYSRDCKYIYKLIVLARPASLEWNCENHGDVLGDWW